jgi:trehalose 6-phosphate phosphatase
MEQPISELKSALKFFPQISKTLQQEKRLFLALDFDGTISEITNTPDKAIPLKGIEEALNLLSAFIPIAIVSGRDLQNLRQRISLKNIFYSGSHGFEILEPGGKVYFPGKGMKFMEVLEHIQGQLKTALCNISGALIEEKKFSIAVHYRQCKEMDKGKLIEITSLLLKKIPELKIIKGKQVLEIIPNSLCNKGSAIGFIMCLINHEVQHFPIFIGDDITDEDAFRLFQNGHGIGVIVKGRKGKTTAGYSLQNTLEVKEFLEKLSLLVRNIEMDQVKA